MDDQKALKPRSTKQVRVRSTCSFTIEIIEKDADGKEYVIDREHVMEPITTFDSKGFQEIYDFFELKRQAKQAELNEEFAQELQRKQESEKSLFQCTVSYLTNLFN